MCVCVCTYYMYIYIYIYMCICIYIYICTHTTYIYIYIHIVIAEVPVCLSMPRKMAPRGNQWSPPRLEIDPAKGVKNARHYIHV